MILKLLYNFFSKVSREFTEILDNDVECFDTSMGKLSPNEVMEIALPVAKEKEFINKVGQPSLTPEKPRSLHYARKKQLVWNVDFNHYFTEEELNITYKGFRVKSLTLAVIRIDDATGEIISAEFTRPFFNEY